MKKKIIMTCKQVDNDGTWEEDYEIDESKDAEEYCKGLINNFNSTLRVGEVPREFISVRVDGEASGHVDHRWDKTNMFTIDGRDGMYDTYKCKECGVTGKRRNLSAHIQRDNKYKAKVYEFCDTAKAQIEKNRKRS